MTQEEKARLYDECIRESDRLQRVNSKLKSDNVSNITPEIAKEIEKNNEKIAEIIRRVESLFL